MKKTIEFGMIALLFWHCALVLKSSKAAFIVTGNVKGLTREEKTELHHLLTDSRFPDLAAINK